MKLVGKGRKERLCPLWPETVTALQDYLNDRDPDATDAPSVFLNASGRPISRFGIRYLLRRYAVEAARDCPSLNLKKMGPHLIRHNTETSITLRSIDAEGIHRRILRSGTTNAQCYRHAAPVSTGVLAFFTLTDS